MTSSIPLHNRLEIVMLETLRACNGKWMDADVLMERLAAEPNDLSHALDILRKEGYEIERSPSMGYRLCGFGDRIIPYEVTRRLDTRIVGSRVISLERTTSTNDVAWQETLSGAPDGTVIIADEQTAGRGRLGRTWHSHPRTGLLMSVVVRPNLEPRQSHLMTVMSAVAVAEALRSYLHCQARIRWPNDITIKGRKVAGLLVEARTLEGGVAFVLGIGINVNTRPEDFVPEIVNSPIAAVRCKN